MESYISKYLGENIYIFTLEGIILNDKNKKTLLGMPSWKNINKLNFKEYCFKNHRALAVITGKMSGITCIDFDVKDGYCAYNDVINDFPELKECRTVKTQSGGFHIYFKYDKDIKTTTDAFEKYRHIDIRNDDAILFAPPTKVYKNRNVVGEYQDMGGEINEIPSEMKLLLKQYSKATTPKTTIENFIKSEIPLELQVEENIVINDNLEDVEKLLELIGSKRCKEAVHKLWIEVGQAIKNEFKEDGLKYFVNWTHKHGSENKRKEAIDYYTKYIKYTPLKDKKRLSIASLHYWARRDNPIEYDKLFATNKKDTKLFSEDQIKIFKLIENNVLETATEFKVAQTIYQLYGQYHKCINAREKIMYSFNQTNKIWEKNENARIFRNLISTNFAEQVIKMNEYFDNELIKYGQHDDRVDLLKMNIKISSNLLIRLYQTVFKEHICKEYFDISFDGNFENHINRKENVLSLKDGKIFDMQTCEIKDKTIDDLFTYECDTSYIPYDESNENFQFVEKYFHDLFCNNGDTTQCVLDIIKSSLIGKPLRYVFFAVGSGRNGKSLLFKVLKKIFGDAMDTISKLVMVKQKGNLSSSINSELEKLVKCRVGYISELKDEDELNTTRIKEITGGDPINYRGLFKGDQTIIPTCNMFCLTNELPAFKVEKAVCDRIINIPFYNEFEVNAAFEIELLNRKDYIFSYIMHKGVIRDKFIESKEMIDSKTEYIERNTFDYLKDFIDETFELVEYDNTEDTRIKRSDLRLEYNNWCKSRNYPQDKTNDATFSKTLNKKYKIENKQIGKTKTLYYIGIKRLIDDDEEYC